ncbi:hypothetical protein [Streptomyces sp. ME19-01-6]|uniref:hypothetical protein n=1 Tax=Streptomyces sp. ME19-01-6 TaxID=3028686 RepID=UPI0029AB9F43|nr:hypothetical protein [Streptomyces sp. ME19-01-6]MDX3230430.1 hypothetical protein [Streptomyces sp. ME19-01-6]
MALAVVRDLREYRSPVSEEELAEFESDVLAGFVLARASAGLVDSTIRNDTNHLELIRDWFGRPLWEMEPTDADIYFGKVLRDAKPSTRTGRAGALAVYFQFLELRHKVELHNLTGRVVECPLDEMNRPRASVEPQLRIPPSEAEIEELFAGWREELVTCRKFGPAARNCPSRSGCRPRRQRRTRRPPRWASPAPSPRVLARAGPCPLDELRALRQAAARRIAARPGDSSLAIRSWIEDRAGELPAGFAGDVRAWLLVLLDGDSRAKPRSHTCLYVYFGCVRPHLENWAPTRGHLREITAADVTAALSPLRGWQRRNAIAALRSLFRFAKKRGLIFANPTTRLKTEDIPRSLMPMTDAEVLAVQQIAVTPAQRLIVALAEDPQPARSDQRKDRLGNRARQCRIPQAAPAAPRRLPRTHPR